MRFRLGFCLVAVVLSALLVGCGGGSSSNNNGPSNPTLNSISVGGSTSMNIGGSVQLTATGKYSDGSSKALTSGVQWSSSDNSIASVDGNGKVTGVAPGSATISATSAGKSGNAGVNVNNGLVSIAVNPNPFSINMFSSVQFSATGTFQVGPTQDVTSTVQWKSSASGVASISSSGKATGVGGGNSNITATLNGITGQAALTVNPVLNVTMDPIGPAILVGAQQAFSASGTFADNSTIDVTALAQWSSSDASKATVAAGTATGVAAGVTTIQAKVGSASASTALNVVAAPYVQLNGSYTFFIESADTRGPAFYYGIFSVDGNGTITGGEEDSNTANGVVNAEPLAGTYHEYPDGRGFINFNPNANHPAGITMRFSLAANGAIGRMIQFDGNGTSKGGFEPQTSTASLKNAIWVFRASGVDNGNNSSGIPEPLGEVGVFSADGAGNISGGTVDVNDFGQLNLLGPLSASTYSTPDASGRGTMQLISAAGTSNYVYYVVNGNRVNFLQIDAGPANAVAGVAEVQNIPANVGVHNLNGGYAFLVVRPVVVNVNGPFDRTEFAQVGEYTFDGLGGATSVSGVRDDTNNTAPNPLTDLSGSYTLGGQGINGRGVFDAASLTQNTDRFYVYYAVSANGGGKINRAFMLQITNFSGGTFNAPTGEMNLQTAVNISNLDGIYVLDASALTGSFSEALMQLSLDGVGTVTGIADVSEPSGAGPLVVSSSQVTSASYQQLNPGNNMTAGRAIMGLPNQIGFQNSVFYIYSPQSAWILGATPNQPAADGSLTKQ